MKNLIKAAEEIHLRATLAFQYIQSQVRYCASEEDNISYHKDNEALAEFKTELDKWKKISKLYPSMGECPICSEVKLTLLYDTDEEKFHCETCSGE